MTFFKTDKSKTHLFSFGGKLLTDVKSPPLFFRSIFNPTHHFLCFSLFFLFVPTDWVGKRCGGSPGLSVIAKNSGGVLLCITTPGGVHHNSQKNHPPQPSIMVITRQGNYMPDKNATSISSDGNGGERQLPRRQSPRLLGRQPILPSPGNNEEEAVAVAIDFAASHNFEGNSDGNDKDNDGGDGIRAGGKRKRGTDEEEMEEEDEEVDEEEEEGWRRLSRKSKSRMSNDE